MSTATGAKGRSKGGRPIGARSRRRRPDVPSPRKGRRSGKRQIPPLAHTYDVPKPPGCYFDRRAADRAVRWIETNCRQHKGRWAGEPLYLMAWQRRLVREVFGWMKPDGTRLIAEVYLEVPRKAGKSTLASAIGLYLALGDAEPGPEVYFAAFDKDQAKVCYKAAQRMVEASERLFAEVYIYESTSTMELARNAGGEIKALSSESAKQYGLNVHGLVFDELMTQRTRTLWDAVTTAEGAREQPLLFAISTAGWDRTSICFEQHRRVEDVMNGTVTDPTFLGVIYGAPIEDESGALVDWTDEDVWLASNPSLGVTVSLDYYRRKCGKALNNPAEQNAFRTLFLSQWVGQERRVIDMTVYERCEAEAPTELAPSFVGFGGLDLSSTTDLTACAIVGERDGKLDVHLRAWIPGEGIVERERRDRVPYSAWHSEGWLELIPGPVIDQDYILAAVLEEGERCDLRDVGYDPWNASQLVVDLENAGVSMVKIRQGFASLSPPMKSTLKRIVEGSFRFGQNPVLRWAANNLAASTDPAGNLKPDKAASSARIDPFVALIMAVDGYDRRGKEVRRRSVYEDRGLVVTGAR